MMSLNNEVVSEEIEALQAIMMDEVDINYDDSGHPNAVRVTVTPATAQNIEEQHVRVTLLVDLPPLYPDESPNVTLRNPKGIDEDVIKFINHEIITKCEEFLGCPVIYELIELVRENLTANNTPSCPCAICLFHFTQSDNFSKTACFHYFHSFCLGRYILNCEELAAAAEEQMSQQPAWMTREKLQLLCPVCREPLEEQLASSKLLENPPPEEGELLEDFSPESPEIKALQQRMSDLYLQQKAKGGIIDLEEEKNRFLVSAPEEVEVEETLRQRFRFLPRERPAPSSSHSTQARYGNNTHKKPSSHQRNQGKRDPGGGGYNFWNSNRGRNGPRRGGKNTVGGNKARYNGLTKNNYHRPNQTKSGTSNVIEERHSSHKHHPQGTDHCNGFVKHVADVSADPKPEVRNSGPNGRGGRNQHRGNKGKNKASSQVSSASSLDDKRNPQASS